MNDDELELDEAETIGPDVFRFLWPDGLANGLTVRAAEGGEAGRSTLFVASTPDEDRALDVVRQDWRLRNYRANPVIFDNHNSYRVVGRADRVGVPKETGNLEVLVRWDLESPLPEIRAVGHQHLNGFRSAGSVGFRSGSITRRDKLATDHEHYREAATMPSPYGEWKWAGLLYEKNELLEFSSASVPMNPYALHKPAGDSGKAFDLAEYLEHVEDPLVKAWTIARETTPRATADDLFTACTRDEALCRRVIAWFESRPAPAPARRALPTRPTGAGASDGLDHLFPPTAG